MYFFIECEPLCQKLWAFLSYFGIFYDARSPNMVMSRDPKKQISKIFYFVLILHLILGKVTKLLVSTSEVISQKPHEGGEGEGVENTPHPVLLGLKIGWCNMYHRL